MRQTLRCLLLLTLALVARQASAQRINGTVIDAASGAAIGGALVTANSARGDTIQMRATSRDGRFIMPVVASLQYVVTVRSIGMQPAQLTIVMRSTSADTAVTITMQRIPTLLPPVNVGAITQCQLSNTGVDKVSSVWNEVSNALASSRFVSTVLMRPFDYRLTQRVLDGRTGEEKESKADTLAAVTRRPFVATSIEKLVGEGYVVTEIDAMVFRAPDESALVDERFLQSHCFWSSAGQQERSGFVGLHFQPVEETKLNDIAGTFWIDTSTFELRSLEFKYTRKLMPLTRGLQRDAAAYSRAAVRGNDAAVAAKFEQRMTEPGGEIFYARLPDGLVVAEKWKLWATDNWVPTDVGGEALPTPRQIRERGGEILGLIKP